MKKGMNKQQQKLDWGIHDIQATLVNSTMLNSILSLTSK